MSILVPGQAHPDLSETLERTFLESFSDDGSQVIAIRRSLCGGGQIIGGCDEHGCSDVWSYPFLTTAVLEFLVWTGDAGTEPEGWIRHQPSNRRRPDGDATREHVAP